MIREQLKEAKKACRFMQNVKPEVKNKALKNISEALIQKSELIIQEKCWMSIKVIFTYIINDGPSLLFYVSSRSYHDAVIFLVSQHM